MDAIETKVLGEFLQQKHASLRQEIKTVAERVNRSVVSHDALRDMFLEAQTKLVAQVDAFDEEGKAALSELTESFEKTFTGVENVVVALRKDCENQAHKVEGELLDLGGRVNDALDQAQGARVRDEDLTRSISGISAKMMGCEAEITALGQKVVTTEALQEHFTEVLKQAKDYADDRADNQSKEFTHLLSVLRRQFKTAEDTQDAFDTRLDTFEEHLEQVETGFEEQRDRLSREIKGIAETFDGLQGYTDKKVETVVAVTRCQSDEIAALGEQAEASAEQLADQQNEIRLTAEQLGQLAGSTTARIDKLAVEIELQDQQTQRGIEAAREFAEELQAGLRDEMAANITEAELEARDIRQYIPERIYAAGDRVHYHHGLFLSLTETKQTPGSGSDWKCISRGVYEISCELINQRKGIYAFVIELSDGVRFEQQFEYPLPTHHGTWDPEKIYFFGDTCIRDGHRWYCNVDQTRADPSKSSDWVLIGMQGPRGRKGDKGEIGETGARGPRGAAASVQAVMKAWNEYLQQDEQVPINAFAGPWVYGKSYRRGDMVSFDVNSYLSTKDQIADMPPTSPGAIDAWLPMLWTDNMPQGRGSAVISSDLSVSDIITVTQVEYDALTPDPKTLYLICEP